MGNGALTIVSANYDLARGSRQVLTAHWGWTDMARSNRVDSVTHYPLEPSRVRQRFYHYRCPPR